MAGLHLALLGGLECRSAGGDAIGLPSRRSGALLAYLAVQAGRPQARERLAGLLWGDRSDDRARADLRKTLSRLRRSLPDDGRDLLVVDSRHAAVRPDAVEVDVVRFERLAADGTPETLELAATLYRGELMAGLPECGEEFDAWLAAERRRLEELRYDVLRRLLDHYSVTGAVERGIQVALRLLGLDPLQESVHRTLMRLYMYQDRVGAALEQYGHCREVLGRELGVAPAPDTERLRAELLRLLPEGAGEQPARERDEVPERHDVVRAATEQRARRRAELAGRPSLVVLSLAGAECDAALTYLGDGLAEDIATELARFRELLVIAPTSAFAYSRAGLAPERIGGELGTTYVVHGGVRPLGESLRITVRLIETATGAQLWAERFDCSQSELLEVGDRVFGCIVGSLVGGIEKAQLDSAIDRRPADWGAYDLCLRGWSALRRHELGAIAEARRCFHQALAKDSRFARAYVGLAMAHLSEWACFSWNHWFFPRQEVLDFARRAVELDDRDHRANCILGVAQLYGGDDEAARRQLMRALDLNPHDADVLAHAAAALAWLGEHELAVEAGRDALRLAPHHPEWYAAFAGIALFAARNYDEAIATMAPAPEALCNTPAFIAATYAHLGRAERAGPHRETVQRHHRRQLARGLFPAGMGCIDWLLAMDPFRLAADAEHYLAGLRKAGFE